MFDVNVFVAECVLSAMSATMEPLSTTLGTLFLFYFSLFFIHLHLLFGLASA